MADSSVPITAGVGTSIDTRTTAGTGDHRQVVVLGDPSTDANVATINAVGALLVQGHQSALTTGTITTATSVVGPVSASNYNVMTVTVRGTYAGVNFIFEASDDGTNYYPIQATRTDVFLAQSSTGVLPANTIRSWDVPIGAFTNFRVRATAWTSGTATIGITGQSMPYEPVPTSGVVNSSTRTTGAVIAATTVVGPLDSSNHSTANILINGTFAGVTINIEGTVDGGTTWYPIPAYNFLTSIGSNTGAFSPTTGQNNVISGNIAGFDQVRVRASAWTSGTANVTISLSALPFTPMFVNVPLHGVSVNQINNVAALAGNGVTGTGSQRVTIASDNTAFNVINTPVTSTTTGNTLSSAATTNATSLKASAGTLYSVTVSNTGAAAAYLKLYNKATAPTVGTDVPVLTITVPASQTVNIPFGTNGFRFATGIAYAITNLAPDSDTTAVAAAQVKVMWSYV